MRVSATRGIAELAREDGGIVVFVALAIPVVLLFLSLTVDIGNWWVHKRHLQLQVDAAALAGGALLGECFADPAGANTAIQDEATRFSGGTGSSYNGQVGGANQGAITVLYQSKTYAAGSAAADDTDTQAPCDTANLSFDVKATEAGLPLIFSVPGLADVTAINAHARVELQKVVVFKGSLPLAVPEVRPKHVTATVVNESGDVVSFFELTGPTPSAALNAWTGSGAVVVPADKKLGVRIGVGQVAGTCGAANGTGGPGYVCYDYSAFTSGVVSIAGYGTAPTAATPTRSGFEVWPTTQCSGSPFFSETALAGSPTCLASVQAKLHFASGVVGPAQVKTFIATVTGSGVKMTQAFSYDAASDVWSTGYSYPVPVDGGAYDVEIEFESKLPGGKKYSSGPIQRISSGSDDTGPIKVATLSGDVGSGGSPYALAAGSHTITVNVGVEGSLQLTPATEMVMLRLTGGSRSSAVACDGTGAAEFRESIINGCQKPYQINDAGICPDPVPPDPADCVGAKTGATAGPTLQGLDERFASCPSYDWPNYDPDSLRVVPLMITDASALGGSGMTELPVTNFAAFYVAGWTGSKCGVNPPPPFDVKKGAIWGHFVKYAKPDPNAETVGPCDPASVTPCVPVMTR
jgi:hypothetical protein